DDAQVQAAHGVRVIGHQVEERAAVQIDPGGVPLDGHPRVEAERAQRADDRTARGEYRAARAELRNARGALARGDQRAASEACARARARAPTLPEAIELEAVIAQARGDGARARKLFQLWLDGGADDPVGEEHARSLLNR
ncbi:MAG TPA: hypothetical protein VIV11_12980, partial [Kofleriaceae bacterium]